MTQRDACVRRLPDGIEAVIPAQRQGWLLFVLPVWLCGWLPMGFSIAAGLRLPHEVADCGALFFQLAWLTIWTVGSLWVLGTVLWSAFGVERARFTRDEVTLIRQISAFQWCLLYAARDVKYLRAFRPLRVAVAGVKDEDRCRVAFDYRGRTVFFATGVADEEAFRLVHAIKAGAPWLDRP